MRNHKHKNTWAYAYLYGSIKLLKSYSLFSLLWVGEREGVSFKEYVVV